MNKLQLIAHLALLKEWATADAAGRARKSALAAFAKCDDKTSPVVAFPFGDHVGMASLNQGVFRRSEAARTLGRLGRLPKHTDDQLALMQIADTIVKTGSTIGWDHQMIKTDIPAGSAPTNKMVGDLRIACGLVIILGPGSSGKTPLAHALAGYGDVDYGLVQYGEPLAGYDHDMERAAGNVAREMIDHSDVVLDSVKDVMALASGAAMKSGIVRAVLPMFTQWSTIAADAGCSLYVPLNPSSPDDDVISLMEEAAKSNSTTMIMSMGGGNWKYLTRGGEGLERQMGDFTTGFNSDGTMSVGGRETKRARVGPTITGSISDELISATIRRSLMASA